MPVTYTNDYTVVASISFPLHVDGKCVVTVGIDPRSEIGLVVNRLEVRDISRDGRTVARIPIEYPMFVTLLGIAMPARLVQSENAYSPMLLTMSDGLVPSRFN